MAKNEIIFIFVQEDFQLFSTKAVLEREDRIVKFLHIIFPQLLVPPPRGIG